MDDDTIAQFTSITNATPGKAKQYLTVSDFDLEQAIQLYFESGGVDMGGAATDTSASTNTAEGGGGASNPITIDDDDDDNLAGRPSVEDDEAMARRMQQEMYGAQGAGDEQDVRAPQARTAQTLLGPDSDDWRNDPDDMHAAVLEQMRRRQRPVAGRPGIFNQGPSIWDEEADAETRRQNLSLATGGASESSTKSSLLAELYRPPFEIMSKIVPWDGIRAEGKEQEKWLLINVQDPNIFDCQVLNRDIWRNAEIQETIKEHFLFKQYNKKDPQAMSYIRFYFQSHESDDSYPHIAIVDPRTGEQVKVWSGTPVPKPMDFLSQLHEFLDRYSLSHTVRNPVATRKAERPKEMDVDRMTEEEMFEMAMKNSLGEGGATRGPRASDPDILTRPSTETVTPEVVDTPMTGQDAMPESTTTSPFDLISASSPHEEPPADPATTTRIQFRHPGGRVVRRFALEDPIRRLYEWLKSTPFEGKEGVPFELVFMGKNLLDVLDQTITQAGLKNGSVMVELIEG